MESTTTTMEASTTTSELLTTTREPPSPCPNGRQETLISTTHGICEVFKIISGSCCKEGITCDNTTSTCLEPTITTTTTFTTTTTVQITTTTTVHVTTTTTTAPTTTTTTPTTTTTKEPLLTVDHLPYRTASSIITFNRNGISSPFLCTYGFLNARLRFQRYQSHRFYISYYGYVSVNRRYANRKFNRIPSNVFVVGGFNWRRSSDSLVYGRVYDLKTAKENNVVTIKSNLATVKDYITSNIKNNNFNPVWALVVTWENMIADDDSSRRVTFQAVFTTDGCSSYVTFHFIDSTFDVNSRVRLTCGFRASGHDIVNRYSDTFHMVRANNLIGNVGKKAGFFIYTIHESSCSNRFHAPAAKCAAWHADELKYRQFYINQERRRTCPCTPRGAGGLSRQWFSTVFGGWRKTCYSQRNVRFNDGRECCYWRNRRFIRNSYLAGGYVTTVPRINYRKWYNDDYYYRYICCYSTNNCRLYRNVRPVSTRCINRRRWSFNFGDPHISTFDGFQYTFNGYGEYVLVSGNNTENGTLEIQARTDLAVSSTTNATVNATVFVVYAGRTTALGANSSNFQIEMNADKDKLVIYGNGYDITTDFQSKDDFNTTIEKMQFTRVNKSQILTLDITDLEVQLTFSLKEKLLDLFINLPTTFENQGLKGLLGNFNNNTFDDLTLPNGTVLSTEDRNYTEREIYFQFGTQWEINKAADSSLFTYTDGKSAEDYRYDTFVPIFADEADPIKRAEAENVCGGPKQLACIYDFLATENKKIALATAETTVEIDKNEKLLNNQVPTIDGPLTGTFEVNKTGTVVYTFNDDGQPTGSYESSITSSEVFNVSTVGNILTFQWTPNNLDPKEITINVVDDLGVEGSSIDLEILLCSGCSGNGKCSESATRTEDDSSKFKLLTCDCNIGYTGDDCETDENACDLEPCLTGQNCTNLTPAEHVVVGRGYNCSACPDGYRGSEEECVDLDECSNSTLNNCDQKCINEIGSYGCSCNDGYRRVNDKCEDIDECTESTSGCEQTCTNTEGNFKCSCVFGYELLSDRKTCNLTTDICAINNKRCEYACANKSGTFECICKSGYMLEANGENCTDINECDGNICSQGCNNVVGSYNCLCYDGYTLQSDKITCKACEELKWGPNCANDCNCNDVGTLKCDFVKGCQCKSGYKGTTCETDINECTETPDICGASKVCKNTDGGYQCECPTGFEEDDNRNCVDSDECASPGDNNCTESVSTCDNVAGSFRCKCRSGYSQISDYFCEDINECIGGNHGCEHLCTNADGSYTCYCRFGSVLNDDRKTCRQVSDPCKEFQNLNCSYACLLKNNAASCYCKQGYFLGADKQTCFDTDECSTANLNGCSKKDSCKNINGGYTCSCETGQQLDNDQRTCKNCDRYHWGDDCANDCNCGRGASECNNVRGCICKEGWTGETCDKDVDECLQDPCTGANEMCINALGGYTCKCKDGFQNESNECINIDECTLGTDSCSQKCIDNQGSYTCSCNDGYQLSGATSCIDIDECTIGISKCEQNCVNTEGSYRCSCKEGYQLNTDNRQSCIARTQCTSNKCAQKCAVVSGIEECSCERGYYVNGTNCTNINECLTANKPCQQLCNDTVPGFTCLCEDGYQINVDKVSCKVCTDNTYGLNCGKNCSCVKENTETCNHVNGSCTCKNGWNGTNCETNINECNLDSISCHNHSTCRDTNGSYACDCDVGYVATSKDQCIVCEKTKYGKNCANTCGCSLLNTMECNNANGSCTCKPGWNGTTCSDDVNECDTANICDVNSKCNNNNGSYSCDCFDGYAKSLNDKCEDINECERNTNNCVTNADCRNSNGSYTCVCTSGFTGDAYNKCEVCAEGRYGVNCSDSCTCIYTYNNTISCNKINGFCTCNTGWTGNNCENDINECTSNIHNCTNLRNCTNTDGSYSCPCLYGYTESNGQCLLSTETITSLFLRLDLNISEDIRNTGSDEYKKVYNATLEMLNSEFRKDIKGFLRIIITSLKKSSLDVTFQVVIDNSNEAATSLLNKVLDFSRNRIILNYNGRNTTVLLTQVISRNGLVTTISASSTPCELLKIIRSCSSGYVCKERDGKATCIYDETDDTFALILGLGVGIPLFLIAALVIIIPCVYAKKCKKLDYSLDYDRREEAGFFSSPIAPKFWGWNRPMYYSSGGWGAKTELPESATNEERPRSKRRDHSGQYYHTPNTRGYYMYDTGATSNYSWDFM